MWQRHSPEEEEASERMAALAPPSLTGCAAAALLPAGLGCAASEAPGTWKVSPRARRATAFALSQFVQEGRKPGCGSCEPATSRKGSPVSSANACRTHD